MTTTTIAKQTELAIFYQPTGDSEFEKELEGFDIENNDPRAELVYLRFPTDYNPNVHKYNTILISEDRETQRYVIEYIHYTRQGPDIPVIETPIKTEYYSMHAYILRIEFKRGAEQT